MKCRGQPHVFLNDPFCRKCFCRIIERRIRKSLRGKIKKGERLLMIGKFTSTLFHKATLVPCKTLRRELSFFKAGTLDQLLAGKKLADFLKKQRIDRVVLPWTADDEAAEMLQHYFSSSQPVDSPEFVKIFREVSSKELKQYAQITGYDFQESEKPAAYGFIREIEEGHPEVILSLVRSRERIGRSMDRGKRK